MSATEVGSLQASLSLDLSNFAQGMQQAVAMVQQFGQQLRSALGNTQGFSALQRQAADLKAEIEAIVSAVTNMQSALNNSSNAAQQFAAVKQHTSGLSGDFNEIRTDLQQIISLLQQLASTATNTANNTQQMVTGMSAFSSAAQQATRSTRQTTTNTRQAATAANRAGTQATKMSNSLKQAAGFAANLRHILSGIVISQSFYRLLNIMNDLVDGSYQFMNNMAQTEIAFKYLLGSAEGASSMIESLQDLSISSPISTSEATEMSRKLMAMGFSAKSVIPALQILTDTAAVFTNNAGEMNDMMQHVVLALGQMKAAGKVSMQELRQLYNAGIPIFQLLQDGLGLTAAEVRNIGKLGIDSGTAILAILTELQKKYTGAAQEMTRTIPGAFEVIKDSIFVINNMLFATPFGWVTEQLNNVADYLGAVVKIARVYGVGGIFQALFPKEWHMALRNVIGTFQQLGQALAYIGKAVGLVFKDAMSIIINIAGAVGPPIAVLVNALSRLAYWVITNIPLVRQLLAILMAYMMLTAVVKVLVALAKALQLVTIAQAAAVAVRNLLTMLKGLWAFSKVGFVIMAVAGAFLALALSSEKAKNAIMAFFGKIHDASKNFSDSLNIGFDPNEIALPEFEDPDKGDWDDITGGLEDIADGYDDVTDSAEEAAKAQKKSNLQSFDEVYTIKPEDEDPTGGFGDMLNDINDMISKLDELEGSLNDIDWTGDFWTDWGNLWTGMEDGFDTDSLDIASMGAEFWKALVDAFDAPEWAGAGIGAAIGTLIGGLFGHPGIGAAIGALVGWVAGLFWEDLKEAFNLSDYTPITSVIVGGLVGALGAILGFGKLKSTLAGVGAGLASLAVSMILGKLSEAFNLGEYTADAISIGQGIGSILGMAVGAAFGHPMLGAAIGNAAGGIVGMIWGALKEKLGVHDWQGIADAVGAGIGAALTGLASGFWSVTITPLSTALTTAVESGVGGALTTGLTFSLKNALKGGILGAIAGLASGFLTNALTGWIAKELDLGESDLQNSAVGQSIGGLIGSIAGLIIAGGNPLGAVIGNVIGTGLGGLLGVFWNSIGEWITNALAAIGEWCTNVGTVITTAFTEIMTFLSTVFAPVITIVTDIFNGITTLLTDLWTAIVTIVTDIATAVITLVTDLCTGAFTLVTDLFNGVVKIFTDIGGVLYEVWALIRDIAIQFLTNLWNDFVTWASPIIEVVSNACNAIWTVVSSIGTMIVTTVSTFLSELWTNVQNIVSGLYNFLVTIFNGIWTVISTVVSSIYTTVTTIFSSIYNGVTGTISNLYSAITTGISNIYTAFKNWASNLWNTVFDNLFGWISDAVSGLRDLLGLSDSAKSSVSSATSGSSAKSAPAVRAMSYAAVPTTNVLSRATPMTGIAGATTAGDGGVSGLVGKSRTITGTFGTGGSGGGFPGTDAISFASAMSKELVSSLAPLLANNSNNSDNSSDNRQPVYVGTLIADDKGLKELERKLKVIRVREDKSGR